VYSFKGVVCVCLEGSSIPASCRAGIPARYRMRTSQPTIGGRDHAFPAAGWSPPLFFPYHYDVLSTAKDLLAADMNDLAVIMAQTATEIATQQAISRSYKHHKLPAIFEP
jgi:hypothetical protein